MSGEGEREHSEDTDTTCTFKTNSFGADISVGRGGGGTQDRYIQGGTSELTHLEQVGTIQSPIQELLTSKLS